MAAMTLTAPLITGGLKVVEDFVTFKMAIFKKSLTSNDIIWFSSIVQASKMIFVPLLAKLNFFVHLWMKLFASSWMVSGGSG